jgi:GH43 family beta-xylosidase
MEESGMLKREDIRIRDPFILTDTDNNCYYMYGTTGLLEGSLMCAPRFSVYKTYDLENFSEPRVVFEGGHGDFWGDRDFWAPEVHKYNGKYYMLGTCKSETRCRATHIFVSDTPDGQFVPVSDTPVTPSDWECLDGTLFVEDGLPYMVFSHEWVQVKNGEICAIRLSDDLTHAVGEPILLFRAADDPNVTELRPNTDCYVTDGPFLFYEDGGITMIWSSFSQGRYLVLKSRCDTLFGNWKHLGSQFDFDGGHAMIFERLDGKRMISLHSPNKADYERAFFAEY